MSTHAGAATAATFSVSLQGAVMEGLAGLKSRWAREGLRNGFRDGANTTSGQYNVAPPVTTALPTRTTPTARTVTEEKQQAMTRDTAATGPAEGETGVALTSAEQDRLLVQSALQGDQHAFGELVTRYQSAVYNMAYRMLGDPTEAEDAAQEVFVRAWNQLHTFQQERRFSTWLLSIASHLCIDLLRRRKPSAPLDEVALYVQSNDPEPDEIALQGEQRAIVQKLLRTLPEKYRSVTVLRYYNDLSYDEIAQMTGLTESAVKTQLHRARRMLADQLAATGALRTQDKVVQPDQGNEDREQDRKEVQRDALPDSL